MHSTIAVVGGYPGQDFAQFTAYEGEVEQYPRDSRIPAVDCSLNGPISVQKIWDHSRVRMVHNIVEHAEDARVEPDVRVTEKDQIAFGSEQETVYGFEEADIVHRIVVDEQFGVSEPWSDRYKAVEKSLNHLFRMECDSNDGYQWYLPIICV